MANLPRPEAIEGQVSEAGYHIERTSFDVNAIEHGWIKLGDNPFEVAASFLYFEKRDDAINVHRNLLGLKGESFLRSHVVIESKIVIKTQKDIFTRELVTKEQICFWVAVEKIDNTLEQYKNSNQQFSGTRLCSQYQNIIRDIIRGMCQIHQEGLTHGVLKSKHVVIIKARAKFAYITNSNSHNPATDFTNLKLLFKDVLGQGPNVPLELKHFHDSAKVNNKTNLRRLYFHPLLMSCGERLLLVVRAHTRLRYRTRPIRVQIRDYVSEFGIQSTWIHNVQEYAYQTVLRERLEGSEYEDESWDQFQFARNTIVHINENIRKENYQRREDARITGVTPEMLQEKSEADVEKDLSSMFPEYLTRVYDFFKLYEITPSLRLHMGELEAECERNIRIQ